ncbi:hypothetical protein F5887DRAFT_264709 [Amanita rubescens]|nr:hypothetical protein F5887DRAFT_264709 [Amanita rubescens]
MQSAWRPLYDLKILCSSFLVLIMCARSLKLPLPSLLSTQCPGSPLPPLCHSLFCPNPAICTSLLTLNVASRLSALTPFYRSHPNCVALETTHCACPAFTDLQATCYGHD